jgi:Protein of unknown function (DUF1488)
MPLTSMNRPGIETNVGVHFGMMHDVKSIRVVVSRGVLRSAASSAAPQDSYLATFEFHRKGFEAIANDIFDRGQRGTIRITASDILQFAAERSGQR